MFEARCFNLCLASQYGSQRIILTLFFANNNCTIILYRAEHSLHSNHHQRKTSL
eukprot:UN03749